MGRSGVFAVLFVAGCVYQSQKLTVDGCVLACSSGETCVEGECVACASDSRCGIECADCALRRMVCDGAACVPASSCEDRADFTRCELVTAPDRSYDICVDQSCVSPGCGDASCNVPAPSFRLADSGQRQCYDDVGSITCGTGELGQDAQYGWDVTLTVAERFVRKAGDEPLVIDTLTGLEWQGCVAGLSGSQCDVGAAWSHSWQDGLALCDALVWHGAGDWHLPDTFEAQSISDYDHRSPALPPGIFPGSPGGVYLWTSATAADASSMALGSCMDCGDTARHDKSIVHLVRCVRGGDPVVARAPTRFERIGQGGGPVVVDRWTGLEWQGCAEGQNGGDCTGAATVFEWTDALAACEASTWAGSGDWRLPSVVELHSIVDPRMQGSSIHAPFPATPPENFWTATSFASHPDHAWAANFGNATVFGQSLLKSSTFKVRCVR